MDTASNASNHPEDNRRIVLIKKHTTHMENQNNSPDIQIESGNDSEFEELDRIPDNLEDDYGENENNLSKGDSIINVKDNGCRFPGGKKEEENQQKKLKYKNIKKELEMVYYRIIGEEKSLKLRKIFTKKNWNERYVLKNPSPEDILSGLKISNRRIFKKIKTKMFYSQFQRLIATKIRNLKLFGKIPKKSKEKLNIYNN